MENINFVYNTTPKFFSENNTFFKKLISTYVGCGKYFYIKNDMLHKQPYFIGKVGPYTFGEEEWDIYNAELKGNIDGLVCGQTTMLVDVEKFMEDKKHPEEELTEFLEKIMHSLLTSNSLQRRKTEEYFENIIKLNKSPAKNYFSFSKNYIRFWNYGWKKEDIDQEKMIKMFKKAKKIANKFSLAEETIYKSCGMPTRFRIAFSCCNAEYAENILSKGDYTKFFVDSIKDFYVEKTKEIIQSKEMLFDCFDGGDVITLHRVSNFNPENIIREMLFIFNSYNLPFFRYKFEKNKEGDLKLDSFIK
jgi:hypothetical protein